MKISTMSIVCSALPWHIAERKELFANLELLYRGFHKEVKWVKD